MNYIVMELTDGMTLKDYIRRKGYLSPKETVEISLQIASAISHAHKNHIIHRDIKPQNILVSESGNIKVTDFGIAKAANNNTVTSTATAMGSVHYISPEQAKGRFCDEKSDIYSLGITMYEMATGHVPFDHENGVTIALMHLQNEIVPPSQIREDIPDSLEKIILKCAMKKPEERYQTAEELISDLKLVFEDTSGEYIGVMPAMDDSPTIMIDQSELGQEEGEITEDSVLENGHENAYVDGFDEEDEGGMNSKLEKLVIVLAAVVGAIILISVLVFVVRSSGLFKSGKSTGTTKVSVTTESMETTEDNEPYLVPKVVGMSYDAAKELIGDNLKIKKVEKYDDGYEEGMVAAQSPESDVEVEKGTEITLTVSKGRDPSKEEVAVPDVEDRSESSAKSTLNELGFRVKVKQAYSSDVKEGYVISQSPSGGTKMQKGSSVIITVSKGEKEVEKVTVPNLKYYTQSEARQQLRNMGLSLGSVLTEYSDTVERGLVIRQTISAGTRVKKGTAVGIYISQGPRTGSTESTEDDIQSEE